MPCWVAISVLSFRLMGWKLPMLLFGHLFESGPSHFTNLRISTKSCSDHLPRRAGLGVTLETDQLFVFIVRPWLEPRWITSWLNGPAGSRSAWRRGRHWSRIGRGCHGDRCCRRIVVMSLGGLYLSYEGSAFVYYWYRFRFLLQEWNKYETHTSESRI